MKGITRFKSWIRRNEGQQGMVCHFYYAEKQAKGRNQKPKQKPHYTKVDYALFNLFSDSDNWIIKGTSGHGILYNGKKSETPLLNCYDIDDEFFHALATPKEEWKAIYELGIILDKSELKRHFGKTSVQKVNPWLDGEPLPPASQTWRYDKVKQRKGKLDPFNYCKITRVKIRKRRVFQVPIKTIPHQMIKGIIVKRGERRDIRILLGKKKWNDVEVFSILPDMED